MQMQRDAMHMPKTQDKPGLAPNGLRVARRMRKRTS